MNRRTFLSHAGAALGGLALTSGCSSTSSPRGETQMSLARDLAGYWPLRGDTLDQSGHDNHGQAHGSGAAEGNFDGRGSFIEIPHQEGAANQ